MDAKAGRTEHQTPGVKYRYSTVVFGLDAMLSNNIPRHLAANESHIETPILCLNPETSMISSAIGDDLRECCG